MAVSKNRLYLIVGIVVLVLCVSLVSISVWMKTPKESPPLAFNAPGSIPGSSTMSISWNRSKADRWGYSSSQPLTNYGDETIIIGEVSMPLELKQIISVDENGAILNIVEKRSDVIPNISFTSIWDKCGEPIKPGEEIMVGHHITGTFLGEFEIKDVYVNYSYKGKEVTTVRSVPTIIRVGLKNWEEASGIVRTIDPESKSITIEWITAGEYVEGQALGQKNTVTLRILDGTTIRIGNDKATFEDLEINLSAKVFYDPAAGIAIRVDVTAI